MSLGSWLSACVGSAMLLAAPLARAECTGDNECKGARRCEQGECVSPDTAPAVAPAGGAVRSEGAADVAEPPAAAPAPAVEPVRPAPAGPKLVRHSGGMMAGGIVMVSLTPIALIVAGTAAAAQAWCPDNSNDGYRRSCNHDGVIYGSLLTSLVLVGVGVPLIVVGAKKEPETPSTTALVTPWATATAAGIGVRVTM